VTPSRAYNASGRQRDARQRRQRVVEVATELFLSQGYGATSIEQIADRAEVSAPMIYSAFGSKAGVLKQAVDVAVVGDDEAVGVLDRDGFQDVMTGPDLGAQIRMAAALGREIHARSADLLALVAGVAGADPAVAELQADLRRQRLESGHAFVGALPPGSLQPGLDVDEACEVLDLIAGPEGWSRLVTEAGWTPERYEAWLADAIERLITGPAPSG
jgi:AcrR family transcriptional regulator